jgi:hypothetical protein
MKALKQTMLSFNILGSIGKKALASIYRYFTTYFQLTALYFGAILLITPGSLPGLEYF